MGSFDHNPHIIKEILSFCENETLDKLKYILPKSYIRNEIINRISKNLCWKYIYPGVSIYSNIISYNYSNNIFYFRIDIDSCYIKYIYNFHPANDDTYIAVWMTIPTSNMNTIEYEYSDKYNKLIHGIIDYHIIMNCCVFEHNETYDRIFVHHFISSFKDIYKCITHIKKYQLIEN